MIRRLLILLLAVGLRAQWDGATSATITWTQTTRSCLYVTHATGERAFIGCWEKAGTYFIELGGPLTDGTVRPSPSDIYTLTDGSGAIIGTAPLVGRPIYLPVIH